MAEAALRLTAFLLAWTACTRAFAHGVPPDAYAVLSQDAAGLRAVSLSAGVAVRRAAQRYQFICPAMWGDQFTAPVAALADGTIIVGASSGLMLLGEDGALRPHPDPAAVSRSSDVVRSARGVFALRSTPDGGSEVLAVDALQARVLWKDTKNLYSMAALDDKLVLMRVNGRMIEQVTLTPDGMELGREVAGVDLPVDNVYARASAGMVYALVVYRDATVALGSVHMNLFTKLAEGELSIAGPLSLGSGTLLALDGKLSQLLDGQATPLADDHNVVCLAQADGLTYACDTDGIARLNGQTLAEPLFLFSWLASPDLARVPEGDARMRCQQQWQDLLFDLNLIGVTPNGDAVPLMAPAAAGSSALMQNVAGAPAQALPPAAPAMSAGCTLAHATRAARVNVLGVILMLILVSTRRGRSRAKKRAADADF